MATRSKQKQNTRERLIKSFFELNSTRPINAITIGEITKQAGVHRSTFYEHFVDIYALRESEENEILNLQMKLIIEPIRQNRLDVLDSNMMLERLRTIFNAKGSHFAVLVGEYGDPAFVNTFKTNYLGVLTKIFDLDILDTRSLYLAEFISSGLIFCIIRLARERDAEIEDIFSFIHPLIANSLEAMRK